jgi:predicted ATPase/class 3 adenylate cyclase
VGDAGLVTILFTDLVGSTELASNLGDVAADELRREHFAHLREAIAATGGTEVKTIGDAVMVSYKGAADALAGAVAMQRAVERHNRGREDHRLEMRVGVSAGDATYEDDDWFGTPVVEASRLCAVAAGGQILVSDLVRALAGSRCEFDVSSLGTRELKGLPAPIALCEVDWQVAHNDTLLPLPTFVDTAPGFPFAGRVEAYETLLATWKETLEGARRAVLVSGEPGIGKTRLVTELVRYAHEIGTTILWGRCDEELGAPFEPFAEALRHYAQCVTPDRLRAELGPLGGELTRVLPELSARVSGLASPMPADADTERHRLFEAVTDFLAEMSHAEPVIIVLDDIHWADKPSLLLLRHLLRAGTPMRLFVLATYRDTDLDRTHPLADVLVDLRREPGVSRLDLVGLDTAEVTTLMESTAGHDLDQPGVDLALALQRETAGNPFFVGEVLRHLAESGVLVQRDGRWTSDLTLGDVGLPEGIREVVGRRLSRLSEAANRALALAAVIGAQFDLSIIEAAGGPAGDELFDALDEAVERSVIREVPGTVGRYAFAHALMRSALYEELTTNRRVRMHAQIATALETRQAHRLDEHLDELAYHFTEGALAGDAKKAVEYCTRAGERADDELAFESAAMHYERALSVLELVDVPDLSVRCDLQLALAQALFNAGDERRREAVFAAAASARALGDPDRLARSALILTMTGGTSDAVFDPELVGLLENALDTIGDAPTGRRAMLLSSLATELQWSPQAERRMDLARQSLAVARASQDPEALNAVLTRGWALLDGSQPMVGEIEALLAEAEPLARATGDPEQLVNVLTSKAFMAACRGDGDAFAAHLDEQKRIADGMRRPRLAWLTRNHMAALAAFRGELDRGEQLANEAVELGQRAGLSDASIIAFYGTYLYQIRTAQGRVGELIPLLEGRVDGNPDVPVWRIALAGALLESERYDEAMQHHLWLAENGCANVPHDAEYAVTLCGLARETYFLRPPEAIMRDVYERLAPFAGLFGYSGPGMSDLADLGLAMNAAALDRPDDADRHFTDGIAICERAGARSYLARFHFFWLQVLADRGDAVRAREQCERAIALGTALGMTGPQGVVPRAQTILTAL